MLFLLWSSKGNGIMREFSVTFLAAGSRRKPEPPPPLESFLRFGVRKVRKVEANRIRPVERERKEAALGRGKNITNNEARAITSVLTFFRGFSPLLSRENGKKKGECMV